MPTRLTMTAVRPICFTRYELNWCDLTKAIDHRGRLYHYICSYAVQEARRPSIGLYSRLLRLDTGDEASLSCYIRMCHVIHPL